MDYIVTLTCGHKVVHELADNTDKESLKAFIENSVFLCDSCRRAEQWYRHIIEVKPVE